MDHSSHTMDMSTGAVMDTATATMSMDMSTATAAASSGGHGGMGYTPGECRISVCLQCPGRLGAGLTAR
jgi:hypothetical protein